MQEKNPKPAAGEALSPAKRKLLEMLAKDREKRTQAIARRPADGPSVLSFGQQRLWFLDRWSPGSTTYNEVVRLRLDGELDVGALRRSLAAVIERHEVLRTTYRDTDAGPRQVIGPAFAPALEVVDLRALSEAERERGFAELQATELATPFDLENGPLVRGALARLSETHYELLVSVHHIACDGWSLGIFVREVGMGYAAHAAGGAGANAPSLPPLAIQYSDYARWQRETAESPNVLAQLEHWKRALPEPAPVLQLPFARPRPDVPSARGHTVFFQLPVAVVGAVQRLARQEDATPFMVLMALYQTLLHRYTGELDVRVGTPVAGRNRVETEGLLGFFVNTLVVRAEISPEVSFREVLRRVRAAAVGAYANQDVPFERLVEATRSARELGHTPLFQAVFVLQNAPVGELALPGVKVTPIELDRGTAKFDLVLAMSEGASGEGYKAALEGNADLLDRSSLERMAGHFSQLLHGALAEPDAAVSSLPWLEPAERAALLAAGARVRDFASDEPMHRAFERQAAAHPEAVALCCGEHTVTYGELDARATRLAHLLRGKGVVADQLVAIYLERSAEMVLAILAILKAGGAYLPIDPVYPADRLAFMIADSGVKLALSQASLLPALAGTGVEAIQLDDVAALLAEVPAVALPETSADDLAYVIYTSGSTGKPKGAQITHRNVARLFTATDAQYGFGRDDVWTLFHSIAFDFSVWEIWGALCYGGRVVVVPFETSRSPAAFYELLVRERVTVLSQTPSAFRQLIREDEQRGADELALRYVIFGGEALDLATLRPWYARHAEERPRLVNMYGITETTVHVTYRPLGLADVEGGKGSVIGSPIEDLECFVLDRHLQPLPIGVPGELYVGGPGLARGYLARPELTAERFIRHPFAGAEDGARLYKTGDLVRRLEDGDLEYLGRLDLQVKIRGFRIELEEIEAVLHQHPAVRECVVLVREDVPGDKRLVAYVVPAPGVTASLEEVRQHVAAKVPEYMVPSAVMVMEAFPLTVNGKLDRKALPSPSAAIALAPAESAPVQGELEQMIAAHWKTVLNLEVVGATDNFFEVGGHSLHMATMQSRLRESLGRNVPMVALFKFPTIRELAQHLAEEGDEAAKAKAAAAETAEQSATSEQRRGIRRGAQASRREQRRSNRSGGDDE